MNNPIPIKTEEEIRAIREGGKYLVEIREAVIQKVQPGISTFQLNEIAENLCKQKNLTPSFKGYGGFPAAMCLSVNDEVVHGIPSKKVILKEGDIISIDFGIFHKGLHTDAAVTVGVGKISNQTQALISTTKEALKIGLEQVKENATTGDIGAAIQQYVESQGFSVVRDCIGHGVGRSLHEPPEIPNFGNPGTGSILKQNMVLAIEPIVNMGKFQVKTLNDNWTIATQDGSLSAHFEHTLVVKKEGYEIIA